MPRVSITGLDTMPTLSLLMRLCNLQNGSSSRTPNAKDVEDGLRDLDIEGKSTPSSVRGSVSSSVSSSV